MTADTVPTGPERRDPMSRKPQLTYRVSWIDKANYQRSTEVVVSAATHDEGSALAEKWAEAVMGRETVLLPHDSKCFFADHVPLRIELYPWPEEGGHA